MSERRFAVVGAGPSGLFTASALAERFPGARVDVIDRQLAPFGLVRYGVAPDHPKIKTVAASFERILASDDVRFLAGIDVGRDVTCDQLSLCYDAVVHATGAPLDRKLGVPGEEVAGVFGATSVVRWYNGHPDASRVDLLSAKRVIVLGAGNVALDVARFLVRDYAELSQTDVPDDVLAMLANRRVEAVRVVARRSPAFTRFSAKELRELDKLEYVNLGAERSPGLYQASNTVARETQANLDLFRSWSERDEGAPGPSLEVRFSLRPLEIVGSHRVEGVRFAATETDEGGRLRDTGAVVDLPADAVVTCVGSLGIPVPGLPFDFDRSLVPNSHGRVTAEDGASVAGHYVAGWLKRGASGVIGTNKPDAAETVECIVEDLQSAPTSQVKPELEDLLAASGRTWYGYEHWRRIDAVELERGMAQGRTRSKLADWDELRTAAGAPFDAVVHHPAFPTVPDEAAE